jgi:putative ABC transport system permease protein
MDRLLRDLRHGARACARAPLVSLLAIVAFALGIGVTTAVFSIFSGVLLKPLPFPHAEQLVAVYDTQPACPNCPASYPKYVDWKTRNHVFSAIGGLSPASFVLTSQGDPEQIIAARATASLVDVFGVRPAIGRWFTETEDQPGGRKVVVLTHAFWTAHFHADPNILGRTLRLDADSYEAIGVMPAGYQQRRAELFVPLARKLDPATRGSHFLMTFARLRDGVTVERAAADMRALGVTLAREFGHNHGIDVRSYTEAVVGSARTPLEVLLASVLVVLLIGCANVANLLLASGVARRRELGIRLALGAGPGDLARQLTIESVLLAATGGLAGVLLAFGLLRVFTVLAANQLPRAATLAIDGRVLAFAAVMTFAVGILCGTWPVLRLRNSELASAVREGDTRTGTGTGKRFGNGLVIAEIALAFALLVGGGLLMKNLALLQARDAGIRTDRVIAFDIALAGPRYQAPEQMQAFYREFYDRLSRAGGVQAAGFVSHLPMYQFGYNGEMEIEGKLPWGPNEAPLVEYRWFCGEYFQTLGIPLLRGRLVDGRDRPGSRTVLINHAMAEKFWPGQDPIGKRFGQGRDHSEWYEVVGVVGDVRSYGLASRTPYEFFRSVDQTPFASMTVVLRSASGDPAALVPAAKQILRSLDPGLPVTHVQTMEAVVADSVGQQRLISALTGLFAALAALLAMVGVYGVMAYNVRRQRRELGIRLAMGADRASVRNLIVARGLTLAAAGIAIGGGVAWVLTGMLKAMLNDVTPRDPMVYAATGAAVLASALLASYLPARSAGRVDPMIVLRDS